ncbi:beta-propeller domain-containing protein [Pseudoxanthomonas wuyuanensis]|uniref:Beta propeller domain-containing protein n=1 Tax=Pseudoxanthomonas wuyuanensis TaxID=1073196 RepID=A0A286D1Y6_9GAMM|nr:beta-propeller domain-containing protein [Pseudoxanthomonas wuyuanensis]KAF1723199.1 hypothetical protein CSC75_01665 [Pseudoxanthomonas wuyuanensis]SOD52639.1 Beta propeller domain-containing protein [Pseudoxanthomonas wuyuanensis]
MRMHGLGLAVLCLMVGSCQAAETGEASPKKTMQAFASEAAFEKLLKRWQAQQQQRGREREAVVAMAPMPAPVAAAADAYAGSPSLDSIQVTGSRLEEGAAESITNVQTQGVDEGGIVKQHGEHLVVLRRGRLFTVRIGGDALQPVSVLDAYAPSANPGGAWYDEMLIAGDTIAVIGYSYERGGTEVGLFDIDAAGRLSYRDTYQLRSNDYYSSRNYASRLIGDQLIFYTPLSIAPWRLERRDFYPALRRWHPHSTPDDFKRILPATRIYRTDDALDPYEDDIALHTVTRCDLSKREMRCESTAVLGPEGRVFYVSADSVFVWTTQYRDHGQPNRSSVFRIPLDGTAPSALKTSGGPVDQLSFLQDAGGYLNVLLTTESKGEGMWAAETAEGDTALLRVRLSDFGDGSTAAKGADYLPLPPISGEDPQNRFIGDWLIYAGDGQARWGREHDPDARAVAYALRFSGRAPPQALVLSHAVERIEALGSDAILVGSAGRDLHFTSMRLDQRAALAATFVQNDAAQGETRTHGFFYKRQDASQGIVGLPIVGHAPKGMQRYLGESASVLYLRARALRLSRMGQLDASAAVAVDDACKASCVDWYGNARPLFIGPRVFALLGYELVEGEIDRDRIGERRRISFAPAAARIAR